MVRESRLCSFAISFFLQPGDRPRWGTTRGLRNPRCVFPRPASLHFRAAFAAATHVIRAAAGGRQHPRRDATGFPVRLGTRPMHVPRRAHLRVISTPLRCGRKLQPARAESFSPACTQNSRTLGIAHIETSIVAIRVSHGVVILLLLKQNRGSVPWNRSYRFGV